MQHNRQPKRSTTPVLVVDDDQAVRHALMFSLQVEGFVVRTYANGRDLLDDPAPPPECCLVIDQFMPGISGLDVVAALRRRCVSWPAILITTQPSAMLLRRATEAGVQVVEKPFFNDMLFHCIRDALAEH
ncbi:MAG TPA: response regulator [Xanthobacteraceae bacterium]|jgi:two-component system response regulator FixJ|nr:response regulator [Xanthobacteraceae bacterium]